MFLSEKQGVQFKKIFNPNIKCNCRFICTCNLTEKPNKIIEGFRNEEEINSYFKYRQQQYTPDNTNTNYKKNIAALKQAQNNLNKESKQYIAEYKPSSNIESIQEYLNKNVQITDIGDISYNYKKCISNNNLKYDFTKEKLQNPNIQNCAIRAAYLNRNGIVFKNKDKDNECYILNKNVNINNIPNNSYYVSNPPIISKSYEKNNIIRATIFKNGDFGMGYIKNNHIIPTYSLINKKARSTINMRTSGCDLSGSMIKVNDATYRNNASIFF